MNRSANLWCLSFIISFLYIPNVRSESNIIPIDIKPIDYILNFKNQTLWPWSMSIDDYEEWFFYYDNLTATTLSPFARQYFTDVNLQNLESAEGVWVAFYGSSIVCDDLPLIELLKTPANIQTLEFNYYIHGAANITIEEGENQIVLNQVNPSAIPAWETCKLNLTRPSVKLWLRPTNERDFVLIDKIIIRGFEETTTTSRFIDKIIQIADPNTSRDMTKILPKNSLIPVHVKYIPARICVTGTGLSYTSSILTSPITTPTTTEGLETYSTETVTEPTSNSSATVTINNSSTSTVTSMADDKNTGCNVHSEKNCMWLIGLYSYYVIVQIQ